MRRALRRTLWLMAAAAGVGALLMGTLFVVTLSLLQPADGEWQTDVTIGPWRRAVSVPVLLRFASHPLGLALLDGRTLHTRFGAWQLQRHRDGLELVCTPCALHWQALGPALLGNLAYGSPARLLRRALEVRSHPTQLLLLRGFQVAERGLGLGAHFIE